MDNKKLLVALSGLILLAVLLACAPGNAPAPTTTAKRTPDSTSPTPAQTSPAPAPKSSPSPTPAAAAAPVSFAGRTLTLIIPIGTGGSTDIIGRLYGRFLTKFLPGNPTVIVRNMPGGEATIGMNYFYSNAKADGMTGLVGTGSVSLADLLRKPGLKFSLSELIPVMGVRLPSVFYMKTKLIDKPESIRQAKGLVYGHLSGSASMIFVCAKEFIEIPTEKVVMSYTSAGEALRAFLSGEVNLSSAGVSAYFESVRPYVDKGEVMPFFQPGFAGPNGSVVRGAAIPDILTAKELHERVYGKSPTGLAYDAYRALVATVESMDKPLFLSPGTPDHIVRAYWSATEAMIKDPEFRKTADVVTGPAEWFAGEGFTRLFRTEMQIKSEVREYLKELLKTKYNVIV